jgi:eukaryotic-like serine/threonine-protein kinase
MALSSGARLGPYEILAPLGAGGMGEVYRARDPRLGREVAIKVLPASFSQDLDRLRRFEQEARAAGVLNHPNITAVYDIGTHDGAPYVVSELLEGETLRARLAGAALAPRKATDYAIQIAQGLAAAHEKGIVHRDLKPENLFVTKVGRVKILDFGLAKLVAPEEKGPQTEIPTQAAATEPGVVLGTIGYMSPEQVRGQAADVRSDIFAFGAILYEMLSGQRAFSGTTSADTMSAILMKEPPDILVTNQAVSPALERIVRHCLEKNPEERFHSAHDVAFDLETLSGISAPGVRPSAPPSARPRRLWPGVVLALLLAAVGSAAYLAGRRTGIRRPPGFSQLTFRRGTVTQARFGPDGRSFVYSAAWEGNPPQLFAGRPGSVEATPLPPPGAELLAVSSSGEMALQLKPREMGLRRVGTLARAPLAGGAPREVLEGVEWADWSPDGGSLAVVRDYGGKNRLEFPIGKPLYETGGFVTHPRVSPKGDLVAFLDHPTEGDDGGALAVVDLTGRKKTLAQGWNSEYGLSWAPGGREIWFTATHSGGNRSLYAVSLDGRERLLATTPGSLTLQDVAPDGRVLLDRNLSRLGIVALAPGETKEHDLSWLDWSLVRDISADGRTILFDESGQGGGPNYSIYIRRTDGSPAVRLGDGAAFSFSPDGKWVAANPAGPPPRSLVLLPTGPGEPRRLAGSFLNCAWAKFFSDGRRIAIAGTEPGHGMRLYVQDLAGGPPRAISPEGVKSFAIAVSPDGKLVSAIGPDGRAWVYPVDGGEPSALKDLEEGEAVTQWSPDGRFLYARNVGNLPARVFRVERSTGRRELFKEITPPDPAGLFAIFGLYASDDGKSYAYTYARNLSDLFLVEGVR